MSSNESAERMQALKTLLVEGGLSTQEELVAALKSKKFTATQSTISRDLRRINAIKMRNSSGAIVYRLSEDSSVVTTDMQSLLMSVEHNGSLIVLRTTPGSASLVARLLDKSQIKEILGTIAGDDTVFVAPRSTNKIQSLTKAIINEF